MSEPTPTHEPTEPHTLPYGTPIRVIGGALVGRMGWIRDYNHTQWLAHIYFAEPWELHYIVDLLVVSDTTGEHYVDCWIVEPNQLEVIKGEHNQ